MEPADCSSLLAPTGRPGAFPQTRLSGSLPIEMAPLYAFIGPGDLHAPALLKVDVQGFELAALSGCASLLDASQRSMSGSFVPLYTEQRLADEVLAYLRDQGFRLSGVCNLRTTEAAAPCERLSCASASERSTAVEATIGR